MSSTPKSIAFVESTFPKVRPTIFSGNQTLIRLMILTVALVLITLPMATVIGLRLSNITYYWYSPLANLYSLAIACFIFSRFVFSLLYRAPKDAGITPTVSIIITAFNEEEAIYRTVECCYAIDHPKGPSAAIPGLTALPR